MGTPFLAILRKCKKCGELYIVNQQSPECPHNRLPEEGGTLEYKGETITFPLDEALLQSLTKREREQIAEIIEEAGQMIERDDAILLVLNGLKALGYERRKDDRRRTGY